MTGPHGGVANSPRPKERKKWLKDSLNIVEDSSKIAQIAKVVQKSLVLHTVVV